MTPGLLVSLLCIALALGHLVRWALERDLIGRSRSARNHEQATTDAPTDGHSAAVLSYALSGSTGDPCHVLASAATATVVELISDGAVAITRRSGDELVLAVDDRHATSTSSAARSMVLAHLRSRSWRPSGDHQRLPIVSTGTLAANPPGRWWWARFRSAVADDALAEGLTERRLPSRLFPAIALIGALGTAAGLIHTVVSLLARDVSRIDPWWILCALLGARLATAALISHFERSDLLTPLGRSVAMRAAHRVEDLARRIPPTADADGHAEMSLGVAGGLGTRAVRQLPIFEQGNSTRIWTPASGTPRVVRLAARWMPADGARPARVVVGGLGSVIAGLLVRRVLSTTRDAQWIRDLESAVPDAFGPLDRHFDTVAALAIAPIVLGLVAVVIGLVDLIITQEVKGVVVDVRLPSDHGFSGWIRTTLSGAGHDGTAVVEIAIDDGSRSVIRPLLVDARAAAPIGSTVLARRTPILGRVRAIGPTGTSGEALRPALG